VGLINTSVTATFGDGTSSSSLPGADAKRWLLEASNRPPIVPSGPVIGTPAQYFRVHPAADELRFTTSSGTVSASVPTLQKRVFEIITFSGGDPWVLLKYPKPSGVRFELLGSLLAATPPYSAVITITYDSLRNIIRASAPCFGMVKVEYRAPYDLWLAHFEVRPLLPRPVPLPNPQNPNSYPNPEDDQEPRGHPMLILARRSNPPPDVDPDEIVASLTLTPGSGEKEGQVTEPKQWAIREGTGSLMPKLRLVIDPNSPVRLTTKPGSAIPTAGCHVLCVPAVLPTYRFTSGNFVSSEPATMAPVAEALSFSGTPSASLRFQPAGDIAIVPVGQFVNKWGTAFTPIIRKPGETVRVVDWKSETEPINPRDRVVGVDELVCADQFGNSIAAYGLVNVDYSITAIRNEFIFDYDDATGEFMTAWIIALNGDQNATLQLSGPVMKALTDKKV